MMIKRCMWALFVVFVVVACQPQTVIVEKEVTAEVTREIEKVIEREIEVTRIVKETVGVEVTPTPTAIPRGGTLKLIGGGDYCRSLFEAAVNMQVPWDL